MESKPMWEFLLELHESTEDFNNANPCVLAK
jgi:hypothetical protein